MKGCKLLALLLILTGCSGYMSNADIDATCLEHRLIITERFVYACHALEPLQ